jgi:hypothetical protein
MGGVIKDRIGQRFGRLTVRRRSPNSAAGRGMWTCVCDCGNEVTVRTDGLSSGGTRSCGCLQKERIAQVGRTVNAHKRTHGLSRTRTYKAFHAAKDRCKRHKDYFGRGIEFRIPSVEALIAAIGECPPGWSLNRIDNDGHYEIGNVEWAPDDVQMNNTRRNHRLVWNGFNLTIAQWARKTGIAAVTIHTRITRYGWSVEKALTAPAMSRAECIAAAQRKRRQGTERSSRSHLTRIMVHQIHFRRDDPVWMLANAYGVPRGTIYAIKNGWSWRHVTGLQPSGSHKPGPRPRQSITGHKAAA